MNGNGTYANASPATLMYAAADGSNNVHLYAVNLANASNSITAPSATQVSNVSLPITGGAAISTLVCADSSGLSGSTNALDPTTLFVVLHIAGSTGCNTTGDTWEVVHYADSATTAPVAVTALTTSTATPAVFQTLYQPGGQLAGIVALDPGSSRLQLFADDSFTNPTTLVASATAASVLYDSGSVGLGSNLFLNVTSGGQLAVYRVPYSYSGGAATAAYTYQATTLGTAAVADNGNVYFTDTATGTPFTPGAVSGSGALHFGGGTVGTVTSTGTGVISGTTLTLTLSDNNVNQGGTQTIGETDVLTGTYSGGTFTATGGTYEYTSCTDVVNSICQSGAEGPLNSPAAFDSVSGTVTAAGGSLAVRRTASSPRVVTQETYTFAAGSGGGSGPAYLIEQLPISGGTASTILSASTAFDHLLGANGSVVVLYTTGGSTTTLYTTPVNASAPAASATAIANAAFSGTFSALTTFMKPTTVGDASTSLIYVSADNAGAFSSEVLSPSGTVEQSLAANSVFLGAGASFFSGSVLQVQGISGTGFGGGSIFDVDPTTLTGGALGGTVLKSGGSAYTVPNGDTVGLIGLSSTIGSGFTQPTGGGTSVGLAYDLSQKVIAPISIANTSVTPN